MPGANGVRGAARRARPLPAIGAVVSAAALAAVASGCGGGSPATAGEPSKTFDIEIVRASFPAKQAVSKDARLLMTVRNRSSETIPNLTATVDSFLYTSHYPELAANKRPVWVVERGPGKAAKPPVQTQEVSIPGGGQTAYVNTWALGPLPGGQTETFVWRVVPVRAGAYKVRYAFAAGLAGNAKARLASGGPATGHFAVVIGPKPEAKHVDPETGQVVPGAYPPASSTP
jgi:hypothetical protein